jgi:acyl carrier protein
MTTPDTARPFTQAAVVERTRTWLRESFLYMHAERTLSDRDPLLSGGVVDSMGVIELVEFLQECFAITVADHEITEDNLGTLEAIGRFVYGKCAPAPATQERPLHVA